MTVPLSWDLVGPAGAPTLVLAHSLGADRSMWEPQSEPLSRSYRVLRVDLRGHGASPSPPGPYSLSELSYDVIAAADSAGVSRFAYCGVSLGGLIGLYLAAHRPEHVTALVAANTASRIGTPERWAERIARVRTEGMNAVRDDIVPRWFAPGFAERAPARFERIRRVFGAMNPQGYVDCCAALADADVSAELAHVRVPTLVVGGTLDTSTPPSQAEALHAAIAGSELTVFDDAAHLSNLDRSEAFTERVATFLERTTR